MTWKRGKIENKDGKETMAFHLLFAKKDPFFRIPDFEKLPIEFEICKKGVIPNSENIMKFDLVRLSVGCIDWANKYVTRKVKNAYSKFLKYKVDREE